MIDNSKVSTWEIGSVVALKTHPFFHDVYNESTILTDDPQLLSPLMIIVETFKDNKSQYDENTGNALSEKGNYQCKCMWYSHRSHHYEDAIISSRLLKIIMPGVGVNGLEDERLLKSYGNFVLFKTARLELAKKKSILKQVDLVSNTNHKTITANLSFASPVMQVVGTVMVEIKEPLIDLKTGERRRYVSRLLIKCKYFNGLSDKFFESLIPIEALKFVHEIKSRKINFIKMTIEEKGYLKTSFPHNNFPYTLIKPEIVNYRNGLYFLEAFGYLRERREEFMIDQSDDQFLNSSYKKMMLPSFIEIEGKLEIKSCNKYNIIEMLKQGTSNSIYRILYEDKNKRLTERTIGLCSIIDSVEVENGSLDTASYLRAYCFLRKAERYFKLERIQTFTVLDL